MSPQHIIVIGCGGTGAALAHDLVLRGFRVSIIERGELFSGSTGRHHGLLHSGARYAVHDREAARECFQENQILRRIAPHAIEQNDGLFVALDDDDVRYAEPFLDGCSAAGIPTRKLTADEAFAREPGLSPKTRLAIQVPDATLDAFRLPLSFLASAVSGGAIVRRFAEVVGLIERGRSICGVKINDRLHRRDDELLGDVVINTTGAWAGNVVAMAGVSLPIQPGPGVMVAVKGRLTSMAINRLHPAAAGDIVVPQRRLTVVGASLWLAEHPDNVKLPSDHPRKMLELGSQLVPSIADAPIRATWCASRPLVGPEIDAGPSNGDDPQQISRTFRCYDHGVRDNRPGLLSVIGGKATTMRAMAESAADHVCEMLGRPELTCRTGEVMLPHYRTFFHLRDGVVRGGPER